MEDKIIMVIENRHYHIVQREFTYKETIERVVSKDSIKQFIRAVWLYKAQGAKTILFKYNRKTSRFAADVLEDYLNKMDLERLLCAEIIIQRENRKGQEMQLSKLSFDIRSKK